MSKDHPYREQPREKLLARIYELTCENAALVKDNEKWKAGNRLNGAEKVRMVGIAGVLSVLFVFSGAMYFSRSAAYSPETIRKMTARHTATENTRKAQALLDLARQRTHQRWQIRLQARERERFRCVATCSQRKDPLHCSHACTLTTQKTKKK